MDMSSSSSFDETLILVSACMFMNNKIKKKNTKKRRSVWIKNWLKKRNENLGHGGLSLLHDELRSEDKEAYRNFLRMDEDCFNLLLSKIEHDITYRDTKYRESINARDRLTITLRYLATGEMFQSLSYHFRVGRSTICGIVPEVLKAISENLVNEYIKMPTTQNEWQAVEEVFRERWNFPNCCGAIDGKHINFLPPRSEGSYYRNYKGHDSIVLMAIADGEYKFLCVDVGANGRISDGGVFRNSHLSDHINNNTFNMPENVELPGSNEITPYVFVGDDAFPLTNRLMKPFRYHDLNDKQKIYNYRLSRARRVIENAFGILANRFRVLLNPINLNVFKVEQITTACCILHNFLITHRGQQYIGDVNMEDDNQIQALQTLNRSMHAGNRCTKTAINLRTVFMEYFNTVGQVHWQDDYISTKQ